MTNETGTQLSAHWDTYYSASAVPDLPSQFCVFVANEFGPAASVVEFGCGNGRDSLFFGRHGWDVIGVDASAAAIAGCREKAKPLGDTVRFLNTSVADPDCYTSVETMLQERPAGPLLVYARFFLHAINEDSQAALLDGVKDLLTGREGMFAAEFRTNRDADLSKVTADHYRRFIRPSDFIVEATARGFGVRYFVEGFGFAKHKNDDAHVTRFLLTLGQD